MTWDGYGTGHTQILGNNSDSPTLQPTGRLHGCFLVLLLSVQHTKYRYNNILYFVLIS